jgi:hypothetical protein
MVVSVEQVPVEVGYLADRADISSFMSLGK